LSAVCQRSVPGLIHSQNNKVSQHYKLWSTVERGDPISNIDLLSV
jgi:hypothetical protein